MPFKKDEHGNYVEQDGLLVFVGPDGAERPYDPDAKAKQIAELTEKSAKRGKELEDFKARYAALADIEDPGAFVSRVKQDAETVASLKDKDRTTEEAFQKRLPARWTCRLTAILCSTFPSLWSRVPGISPSRTAAATA